jgi:hypothetical protein
MRRAERGPARIHHHNGFAAYRLSAIQDVAGENPGMSGCDAVGPFSINPDGVQFVPWSKRGWELVRATGREPFVGGDPKS